MGIILRLVQIPQVIFHVDGGVSQWVARARYASTKSRCRVATSVDVGLRRSCKYYTLLLLREWMHTSSTMCTLAQTCIVVTGTAVTRRPNVPVFCILEQLGVSAFYVGRRRDTSNKHLSADTPLVDMRADDGGACFAVPIYLQ